MKAEFEFSDKKNETKEGAAESKMKQSVDEVLQDRKEVAKEYLVTNNRNWGKMSAMILAAQTRDREIIAHDLCWKIICKVWRNGKLRQQANIFAYIVMSFAKTLWAMLLQTYEAVEHRLQARVLQCGTKMRNCTFCSSFRLIHGSA